MNATPLGVTLLTGFLGAGKTTLLKRLVSEYGGDGLAIVLNEIGDAGVDTGLPRAALLTELAQSCACCVQSDDFTAALAEMAARGDVDRVVLETTGLADPLPIIWRLQQPSLAAAARLDAVITVVDCRNYTAAPREEWSAQVLAADIVILTKIDLVAPARLAEVRAAVAGLNSKARVVTADEAPLASLFFDAAPRPPATTVIRPRAAHSDFGGLVLSFAQEVFDLDRLEDWLEGLPPEVFRVKGVARTGGGFVAFHVVGGRLQLELEAPPPAHGQSRIAIFGRRLDRDILRRDLDACVLDSVLGARGLGEMRE